jgi:hypothetical protein
MDRRFPQPGRFIAYFFFSFPFYLSSVREMNKTNYKSDLDRVFLGSYSSSTLIVKVQEKRKKKQMKTYSAMRKEIVRENKKSSLDPLQKRRCCYLPWEWIKAWMWRPLKMYEIRLLHFYMVLNGLGPITFVCRILFIFFYRKYFLLLIGCSEFIFKCSIILFIIYGRVF